MNFTIGSDPEFFVKDRHGNFVSAIGIVKADKEHKVSLPHGHKLFYDNVLAEMNIVPGVSEDDFIIKIKDCLLQVSRTILPNMLWQQASAMFPATECQHPDAKRFGCEPEYCAYDLKQILAPTCEDTFRSAGGHVHLGQGKDQWPLNAPLRPEGICEDDERRLDRDWGRIWVVRMLDLFLGLPSILLDRDPSSPARRKLYGKAGTHRPQEAYGVEYRATGNFWLASPDMARLVYRLCDFTVQFVGEKNHLKLWKDENKCVGYDVKKLRSAINESDRTAVTELMESVVKEHMPADLLAQVYERCEPRGSEILNSHAILLQEWGIA